MKKPYKVYSKGQQIAATAFLWDALTIAGNRPNGSYVKRDRTILWIEGEKGPGLIRRMEGMGMAVEPYLIQSTKDEGDFYGHLHASESPNLALEVCQEIEGYVARREGTRKLARAIKETMYRRAN